MSSCSKALATGAVGRSLAFIILEKSWPSFWSCSEVKFDTDGMEDDVAGEEDDGRGERWLVFMLVACCGGVLWCSQSQQHDVHLFRFSTDVKARQKMRHSAKPSAKKQIFLFLSLSIGFYCCSLSVLYLCISIVDSL